MIETGNNFIAAQKTAHIQNKKALRSVDHDRMAGSMPVWDSRKTAQEDIAAQLSHAQNNPRKSFEPALSYADSTANTKPSDEFGFGDLLDMVNPLHHIPLVGNVYRHITGDEIKPISRIIGGAAFGGAAGVASSMVNVIVEQETGSDIAGNAMAFATGERSAFERSALSDSTVLAMADLTAQSTKRTTHPYQYND